MSRQKECKHKEIHIDRFDQGIEKVTVVTCLKCEELLCEQKGPFILANKEDTE